MRRAPAAVASASCRRRAIQGFVGLFIGYALLVLVESMSRCLAYAEGVVTMVCPVLLAVAVKKINWKGKVEEPVVPMLMLLIAGATLITGICPLLAFCVSARFSTACERLAPVTRGLAAPFSSACQLALACWISLLIVPVKIVIPIGFAFGLGIVALLLFLGSEEEEELHTILDKSHEFLSGVTGILFLGLEGLALEGLISTCHGIHDVARTPMGIIFGVCALGVYLVFLVMIYPLTVKLFTDIFDLFMVVGTLAILATIMNKLMGLKGLLFFSSPFLIFFQLAYRLVKGDEGNQDEECKAAPLGLTKVTFTGFLAVSVTSISSGSTNEWTDWFLLFAAAAIASGLSWRLLTHTHTNNKKMVEAANEAANVASFCTHFCIAVATVLFTVMAWEAANKVQVTCSHGNN